MSSKRQTNPLVMLFSRYQMAMALSWSEGNRIMTKSEMRALIALGTIDYLARGKVITKVAADHRSRPRQKIGGVPHRVIPMWQRLAIASMR